jgi:hypothetical protein
MIKQTSSSPNPLTIVILTYKRKDNAIDVIGMRAKAACLRTREVFPTAARASGSMNIESDMVLQCLKGRLYVVKRLSRPRSLPSDVAHGGRWQSK